MADNITVPTQGTGTSTPVVATDDVAGVHYQRVKLDVGGDGASVPLVAGGGVEAAALRVTLASDSTGLVSVDDNGGSLTVDATSLPLPTGAATAANQLPDGHNVTVDNAAGASAVNIQDGGNSITVDGTVAVTGVSTVAEQQTQTTALQLIDDPVSVLGTATYAEATSSGMLVGVVRRDADTSAVNADNEVAPLLVNANGALKVEIFDGGESHTVDGTVAVSSLPALVAGTANIGDVDVLTVPAPLSTAGGGTEATALRVTLANDSTGLVSVDDNGGSLTVDGTVTANLAAGTNNIGDVDILSIAPGDNNIGNVDVVSITPPTLTKGTQGATGFSVQDLKDGGRVIVNAATAIAGVTAVTTEALLALDISRDGAATSSATTHAVTGGKRWRVTAITVGHISTSAAVLSSRISLRMNPSGAVTTTSPIIVTAALSSGAAVAQQGKEMTVPIPDGVEFSGSMQIGLSHVASATTGTVWGSIIGYEY